MIKLIEILILIVPAVSWKLWKDRNGTVHPNREPITVFIIMNVCVLVCAFHLPYSGFYSLMIALLKAFSVSITGSALIFPYLFNWHWWNKNSMSSWRVNQHWGIIRAKREYILEHLSDTAIPDRWKLWRSLGWFGRLLVYVVFFMVALTWFIN